MPPCILGSDKYKAWPLHHGARCEFGITADLFGFKNRDECYWYVACVGRVSSQPKFTDLAFNMLSSIEIGGKCSIHLSSEFYVLN